MANSHNITFQKSRLHWKKNFKVLITKNMYIYLHNLNRNRWRLNASFHNQNINSRCIFEIITIKAALLLHSELCVLKLSVHNGRESRTRSS